ncbi:MAG: hypothetical protein AAFV53_06460 [Myxococcota bacterium]
MMRKALVWSMLVTFGCAETSDPQADAGARNVDAAQAADETFIGEVPDNGNWLLVDVPAYAEDCGFGRVLGARLDALMLGQGNFSNEDFLSYRIFSEEGIETFQIANKAQGTTTQCTVDNDGAFTCEQIEAPYVSQFTNAFSLTLDWTGQLDGDRIVSDLAMGISCAGSECSAYSSAGFTFPCDVTATLIME